MPRATVAMPGSCGELVQGTIEGIPFHITCPVDVFSLTTVELGNGCEPLICPMERTKASAALHRTLELLGKGNTSGRMTIESPLPLSKGMASSTADVAGAVEATCHALGHPPDPSRTAQIALGIEPSDGTFFPGIVAFDHRQGKLLIPLGMPPPIDIIVLDCGGQVDTLAFNARDWSTLLRKTEPRVKEAFTAVKEGIASADPDLIGMGATISARANQEIAFKPQLEKAESVAREVGAVGINIGHSGTVIGILLDAKKADRGDVARYVAPRLDGLELLFVCSLVGGGGRLLEGCVSQSSYSQLEGKKWTSKYQKSSSG